MIFHVAGNAVFDLRLPQGLSDADAGQDRWSSGNVLFAQQPPTPMLGGCGAAAAYALARLSHGLHDVRLNTRLGADLFGGLLHNWLVAAGVEPLAPPEPTTATSTHVIHTDGSKRRSVFYRGERVDWTHSLAAPRADWFLAAGYGLVEVTDAETLGEVCQQLAAAGTQIIFDPGPWFAQRVTAQQMAPLWPSVDILVGTADELLPYLPEVTQGDAENLAAALLALGVTAVVVKQGADGASWASSGKTGQTATQAIEAGYSVGAGDTFNARLLFGLSRGDDLSDATRAAAALATRVVASGRGVMGAFDDQPAIDGLSMA